MWEEFEERLIRFVISIYDLSEDLTGSRKSEFLSKQLMHSASLSALTFGEAQNSRNSEDFIEKIKEVNSKLKVILVHLQIAFLAELCLDRTFLENAIQENYELVSMLEVQPVKDL